MNYFYQQILMFDFLLFIMTLKTEILFGTDGPRAHLGSLKSKYDDLSGATVL
jgi:hypothetical protein